jgi:DNA polymerase
MDRARRLEYLRAMGVEAWERRDLPPPPLAAEVAVEAGAANTVALSEAPPSARRAASPEATGSTTAQPAVASAGATSSAGAAWVAGSGTSPASAAPRATEASAPSASHSSSPPAARRAGAAEALARIPVISPGRAAGTPAAPEVEADWETVKAEVLSCTKCGLHSTRTQGVFGVGNRRAEWLVIGEAPGAEEDRRGEPFVGRAGQLLNAMLAAIGLPREQVFIVNVLKSRPPNNRDPKPDEVAACLPFLMRQIALLQPRLMLAVGRIAAQNLLATDMPLGRLRGQLHSFGELNTPLIVTYHPAYLLRTPADKRKAWEDLKFARSTFQRLAAQEE